MLGRFIKDAMYCVISYIKGNIFVFQPFKILDREIYFNTFGERTNVMVEVYTILIIRVY